MAMKQISSFEYNPTLDDIVEVLKNVFDGEAEEWEKKKGKSLSNQSDKNKRKFVVKTLSPFQEEQQFRQKGVFNKYSSKVYKLNSLTRCQFAKGWGISELLKNPEYILRYYKIEKGV